jgi:hypothetical protein
MSLFRSFKVVDIIDDSATNPEYKETFLDLTYTPKERIYYETNYEKTIPKSDFDTKVPKFSTSVASISYDSTRSLNFFRTRRMKQNYKQYNDRMPIPYNISMNLFILAKYEGHIFQIVENIIPYVSPYIILKIKENIAFLKEIPREIKIDFTGDIGREVSIEWADTDRRIVRGQLDFTIKGWIYKPISTSSGGPILHIPITFYDLIKDGEVGEFLDYTEVVGPNWNV